MPVSRLRSAPGGPDAALDFEAPGAFERPILAYLYGIITAVRLDKQVFRSFTTLRGSKTCNINFFKS